MSERASALADQFERVNAELLAEVERCPDDRWTALVEEGGRPAGVVAHHVAVSYLPIAGMIRTRAAGESPPPMNFDEMNAEHAREHANVTKAEVRDALRQNGPEAARFNRELRDEDLDRPTSIVREGTPMTIENMVQFILIGHPQQHLAAIRAAPATV